MATRTASAAPRVMCYVDGHQAHQAEPVELSGLGIIEDRTPKMSKSQMGRGIATAVLLFITGAASYFILLWASHWLGEFIGRQKSVKSNPSAAGGLNRPSQPGQGIALADAPKVTILLGER